MHQLVEAPASAMWVAPRLPSCPRGGLLERQLNRLGISGSPLGARQFRYPFPLRASVTQVVVRVLHPEHGRAERVPGRRQRDVPDDPEASTNSSSHDLHVDDEQRIYCLANCRHCYCPGYELKRFVIASGSSGTNGTRTRCIPLILLSKLLAHPASRRQFGP